MGRGFYSGISATWPAVGEPSRQYAQVETRLHGHSFRYRYEDATITPAIQAASSVSFKQGLGLKRGLLILSSQDRDGPIDQGRPETLRWSLFTMTKERRYGQ